MSISKVDEKKKLVSVKAGQKVQIGLPKLCSYDDDDEDDDEKDVLTPKPTLRNLKTDETANKPTEKLRSGLLGILPPPKSSQNPFLKNSSPSNSTTVKSSIDSAPSVVEKSTNQLLLPRHMMGKLPVKIADQDTEYRPTLKKPIPQQVLIPEEDPEPFANEENDSDSEETNNQASDEAQPAELPTTSSITQQILDKEAVLRLCGSQGKKRKMEEIELTDVSANQIVGDNKAELLKQVTEEYRPPSNKEYFTTSSRRTHHVTYLAKVALERDQELRATWASNKFNKKMAREKYGF